MISRKNQFPKASRVHLRNDISFLFTKGRSINAFPVKAVYKIEPPQNEHWLRIAVSVPKRNFKKLTSLKTASPSLSRNRNINTTKNIEASPEITINFSIINSLILRMSFIRDRNKIRLKNFRSTGSSAKRSSADVYFYR